MASKKSEDKKTASNSSGGIRNRVAPWHGEMQEYTVEAMDKKAENKKQASNTN